MTAVAGMQPGDLDWHDGVFVDFRVYGLLGDAQQAVLTVDLYPDQVHAKGRLRYECVGEGLISFNLSANCAGLVRHRRFGNIAGIHISEETNLSVLLCGAVCCKSAHSILF